MITVEQHCDVTELLFEAGGTRAFSTLFKIASGDDDNVWWIRVMHMFIIVRGAVAV